MFCESYIDWKFTFYMIVFPVHIQTYIQHTTYIHTTHIAGVGDITSRTRYMTNICQHLAKQNRCTGLGFFCGFMRHTELGHRNWRYVYLPCRPDHPEKRVARRVWIDNGSATEEAFEIVLPESKPTTPRSIRSAAQQSSQNCFVYAEQWFYLHIWVKVKKTHRVYVLNI